MPGEHPPPSKAEPHLDKRAPADAEAHCAREAAALPLPDRPTPHLNERAQADADARRVREAAALRENLRRRKTQTRAREEAAPAPQATRPEIG